MVTITYLSNPMVENVILSTMVIRYRKMVLPDLHYPIYYIK
jgi:hypothetical protein